MIDPVVVDNLVRRVRRDGYRLYNEAAKAELVAQVREGKHSAPLIARANGVNANLLQKWIAQADAAPRPARLKRVPLKTIPTLLPIKIVPPPVLLPSHTREQMEVRCKNGTILLAATANNMSLLVQALSA